MRHHKNSTIGWKERVFFRTKRTKSGEYLQLVGDTKRDPWIHTPRRQRVIASLGQVRENLLHELRASLDRILKKAAENA